MWGFALTLPVLPVLLSVLIHYHSWQQDLVKRLCPAHSRPILQHSTLALLCAQRATDIWPRMLHQHLLLSVGC